MIIQTSTRRQYNSELGIIPRQESWDNPHFRELPRQNAWIIPQPSVIPLQVGGVLRQIQNYFDNFLE
jgi:hypothetical protein